MSMEVITGAPDTIALLAQLWEDSSAKGAWYSDIILSNAELGTFDACDPNVPTLARYATFYWPGGAPRTGNTIETLALQRMPEAREAEVRKIRSTILGAMIGAAALERVPVDVREMWQATESIVPPPIEQISAACKRVQLPLSVCAISDLVRDPDRQIVHMWYPANIHPEPVLQRLQGAIEQLS